jgi:anaerobic magnesium-protoporphyrin IX monomethyl ester cyclase
MAVSLPKVLLVYPPISKMERYGSELGVFGGKQIPLGLFCLAAYLRQQGYPVHALDAEARELTYEDILAELQAGGYNVLAISSTTVAFHRARELADAVKTARPDTTVIIGGPHVSSQPEHPLQFPAFDFAIRNEGEETLDELLRVLAEGGDPGRVPGLVYRRGGQIVVNPPRPYIADLDALPFPAYDLIPDLRLYSPPPFNYQQLPVANIITSRGCPNACTFCENTTFGRRLRIRSASSIVGEIELLMRQFGAREISFVDDTFTVKRSRIYEIFDLARQRGLQFPWSCMSRINTVDEDLLRYMRDQGCWYISFGVESADEDILRVIHKNIKPRDVERVIQICHRLGIVTKGFFMIGNPRETVATIDKTIAFAKRIPLRHVVVTINTPMPGTEQYRHAREYGTLDETDWKQFNYWKPVFVPYGLTPEILLAKQQQFIRQFYLRPRLLLRQLQFLLSSPSNLKQLLRIVSGSVQYLWRKRV